jgi:acetoacetyl-CoA synthetase
MTATQLDSTTANGAANAVADLLWQHPNPRATPMWKFLQEVGRKHGLELQTYRQLYQWSIENIALFWEDVWEFVGIRASVPYQKVRQISPMRTKILITRWFAMSQ